jgi:hypothetical protein
MPSARIVWDETRFLMIGFDVNMGVLLTIKV